MANDFFTASGNPATASQGSSATMRAEFESIEDGFDKLPVLTGNGGKVVVVNSGGTALETIPIGTNVANALAVNVGSSGAFVVNGGALGTPSSGTVTNLTGTASININGTVGATTPTTGAFTTVAASGVFTGPDGSASAPTYSFSSSGNSDNGMYLSAANEVSWATSGSKYLTLTSDGRLYGTALHNNAGAVTGTTNQYIASGTYNPTITGVTNISSVSKTAHQWMRVGNVVTVSGECTFAATATGFAQFTINLPIASNITFGGNLSGAGSRSGSAIRNDSVVIYGNAVSDVAVFEVYASDTNSRPVYFTFMYLIN